MSHTKEPADVEVSLERIADALERIADSARCLEQLGDCIAPNRDQMEIMIAGHVRVESKTP